MRTSSCTVCRGAGPGATGKSGPVTPAVGAAGAGPASAGAAESYEALRRQALGIPEASAFTLGLAVLVHRGVAEWLSVTASAGNLRCGGEAPTRDREAAPAREPLIACLVQMILARGRRRA